MRKALIALFSAIVIAGGVVAVAFADEPQPATPTDDTASGPSVTVRMGDKVDAGAAEGDEITGAVKTSDGSCDPGKEGITISGSGTTDIGASVSVSFDGSCNLRIDDISVSAEPAPPPSDGEVVHPTGSPDQLKPEPSNSRTVPLSFGSAHRHRGWSKATVQEQFGVTSTETYSEVRYWQNNSDVYDGFGYGDSYCYHSSYPGWDPNICEWAILDLTGPGHITAKVHGYYHNSTPPRPTWSLDARFHATDDNDWVWSCHLYDGTLPPLWDLRCDGGRTGAY